MLNANVIHQIEKDIKENRFREAERTLLDLAKTQDKKYIWLNKLAEVYFRARLYDAAEETAEISYNLNPDFFDTVVILTAIAAAKNDIQSKINWALKAITLNPRSAPAYNNLGSGLFTLGLFREALQAFETAIALQPNLYDTMVNIGTIYHRLGESDKAITYLKKARSGFSGKPGKRSAVDFHLSLEYLLAGDLKAGWKAYEGGFSTDLPVHSSRAPNRSFVAPRWKGQPLRGKTLLVWREQGVGDEIMFMSCYRDLAKLEAKIIIEADPRLVPLLQQTYPDYTIRSVRHGGPPNYVSIDEDYDYQIPAGSLPLHFRQDLDHFQKVVEPTFAIDEEDRNYFLRRIGEREGKLVGVCWRSGLIDHVRKKSYTDIDQWGSLLRRDDLTFVCLQYDDCDEELARAKELFGAEIIKFPGIDLKNDFKSVSALISCLDVVVSVGTAVVPLSGATGTPTYLLTEENNWTLLGANYPWYASVSPISVPVDVPVSQALNSLHI